MKVIHTTNIKYVSPVYTHFTPNYEFNFMNGTLNIVNGQSQTITFPALPNVTFGTGTITLNATASSGLPNKHIR